MRTHATSYAISRKSQKNRVDIYKELLKAPDCPIITDKLSSLADLFYEPFYQLMRQQLLAHEMEKAGEQQATKVTLLHIAPEHNQDIRRITSPNLQRFADPNDSPFDVWKKLVRPEERFISKHTEELFAPVLSNPPRELQPWRDYISKRYVWVI